MTDSNAEMVEPGIRKVNHTRAIIGVRARAVRLAHNTIAREGSRKTIPGPRPRDGPKIQASERNWKTSYAESHDKRLMQDQTPGHA